MFFPLYYIAALFVRRYGRVTQLPIFLLMLLLLIPNSDYREINQYGEVDKGRNGYIILYVKLLRKKMKKVLLEMDKKLNISIVEKPEEISWEQITMFLHNAYKEKLLRGMNYAAATQSVGETIKRATSLQRTINITYCALKNTELVGTITVHIIPEDELKFEMLAVHPLYQNLKIGRGLLQYVEKIGKIYNCKIITCNTSSCAQELVSYYTRKGYNKVGLFSSSRTNYYSIKFEKYLRGICLKKYFYYLSCCKTWILFDRYGNKRIKVWLSGWRKNEKEEHKED